MDIVILDSQYLRHFETFAFNGVSGTVGALLICVFASPELID